MNTPPTCSGAKRPSTEPLSRHIKLELSYTQRSTKESSPMLITVKYYIATMNYTILFLCQIILECNKCTAPAPLNWSCCFKYYSSNILITSSRKSIQRNCVANHKLFIAKFDRTTYFAFGYQFKYKLKLT